jgi:endonuclease/exonuclease/phosphatase family metal-dependent hydrolase
MVISLLFISSCNYSEQQNIEVMSFNIRYDNPDDGLFSWDNRKDMVFWIIDKYDPDIIGMQEVLKGQLAELEENLTDYRWSGVGRVDGAQAGEYVPIFFKKDRFMLADEGHFWLSENPDQPGSMGWDAACTRMVSWVKLVEVSSTYEYFVFNTHFDHVGEQARLNSAYLLSDTIRQMVSLKPTIICGDLNTGPDSDPLKILSEFYIQSRRVAINADTASPTSFVGFPANPSQGDVIDHIFHSRHFNVEKYEIISDNSQGFYPSDHLPVMVSLKLIMP